MVTCTGTVIYLFSLPALGSDVSFSEQRSKLYDNLARDLQEKGPAFLSGATSQSLSLSDIFTLKDGVVTPILKVYTFKLSSFLGIFLKNSLGVKK